MVEFLIFCMLMLCFQKLSVTMDLNEQKMIHFLSSMNRSLNSFHSELYKLGIIIHCKRRIHSV
jgi:hypothetical protein